MTTYEEVMEELRGLGMEENRGIYARYGVRGEVFGVSSSAQRDLSARIGCNSPLAEELWRSGVYDARILALLIADPDGVSREAIEEWAGDLDSHLLTDAFAEFVARTPWGKELAETWMESEHACVGRAGWEVLAHLAARDADLGDDYLVDRLGCIERKIRAAKGRVQEAMYGALMAIGQRNPALAEHALGVSQAIGIVEIGREPRDGSRM